MDWEGGGWVGEAVWWLELMGGKIGRVKHWGSIVIVSIISYQ